MQYYPKRPISVSIAVVLGSIGVFIVFFSTITTFIASAEIKELAQSGLFVLLFSLIQLYILMGMWHMKKMALIVYTALYISILLFGVNHWYSLIMPIFVIAFGYLHYRDMK